MWGRIDVAKGVGRKDGEACLAKIVLHGKDGSCVAAIFIEQQDVGNELIIRWHLS